jgi:hypothetical protein
MCMELIGDILAALTTSHPARVGAASDSATASGAMATNVGGAVDITRAADTAKNRLFVFAAKRVDRRALPMKVARIIDV